MVDSASLGFTWALIVVIRLILVLVGSSKKWPGSVRFAWATRVRLEDVGFIRVIEGSLGHS